MASAKVTIDTSELKALADRITDGAVSTFLAAAHRQMDPVVEDASSNRQLWPRRTGASQAGTVEVERISADSIELVTLNAVPYTFKLRFSIWPKDELDDEAARIARQVWGKIGRYVDRGWRPGAKQKIANYFLNPPPRPDLSAGEMRGWAKKMGEPSAATLQRHWRRKMTARHGRGAPSRELAAKHVWSVRVRTPVKRGEEALVREAREALDNLAGG